MADTKYSALSAATSFGGTDQFGVNQSGNSKQVTGAMVLAYIFVSNPYAAGTFTIATGFYSQMVQRLTLTSTQRLTINGTGRLRID